MTFYLLQTVFCHLKMAFDLLQKVFCHLKMIFSHLKMAVSVQKKASRALKIASCRLRRLEKGSESERGTLRDLPRLRDGNIAVVDGAVGLLAMAGRQ
jgi:hypothetical protein